MDKLQLLNCCAGDVVLDTDWKIAKGAGRCAACAEEFGSGAETYSALIQTPHGLQRQDLCTACFQSQSRPEGLFYFWKNSPARAGEALSPKARPALDANFVLEFFTRLEHETEPQKLAFRYILALMLARKKILVPVKKESEQLENGVRVGLWKEKNTGNEVRVAEPELNPDELGAVSAELAGLLGMAPTAAHAGSGTTGIAAPAKDEGVST